MDGKYVGNRPIRLTKIKEDKYGTTSKQTISARKVGSHCSVCEEC